ncbi:MAG: TonB-dependent receptor [Opitutaceae bacterium]|nr:TonB-dependent receptor [Opitutaceae bacterium]
MNPFACPLRALALCLCLAFAISGHAAPTDASSAAITVGSISGRIFNPATGEYVRNAEVSVRGSPQVAVSENDGAYRLTGVPAGEAVVTVNYTGYPPAVATVAVEPGRTSTRDIELVGAPVAGSSGAATKDEILKLAAFTVSSEREGNAKAIMEQRNSMNITNSVASDAFGEVAEGNVGEFLKHMPGVDLFLVQGEIVNVRLRGLSPEYNSVTIDGVSLASADANKGAAGDARAFSFEQASLSSLDSIEVSKTISADVDANAPAGSINLKSKRAFSRAGRRLAFQTNVTAFVDEIHLNRTHGPDDERHYKLRPSGSFEYSDVFLDRRLGVVLSAIDSNMYSENARTTTSYNTAPTAADPRPVVPTSIQFTQSPRINRRTTVTLTTDFKATSNLVLSLGLISNYSYLYNIQRGMTFAAGARAAVAGANPAISFTSAPTGGTVTTGPASVSKRGQAFTVLPKFEYKIGRFTIDGKFAGSGSKSWYDPFNREGSARSASGPVLSGVRFTAERSALNRGDWRITQIGGPDFSLGDGYTNPVVAMNDGRYGRTQVYSADVSATWKTSLLVPVAWKTGAKLKREIRDFRDESNANRYAYVGPGAGPGAWAGINSPYRFAVDAQDGSIASSSGQMVFVPDLIAIGRLFREHPEYFTHTMTADNYYSSYVANTRHFEEDITSGFLMGTANIGRAIVRAGLRYEDTGTDAYETDPLTAAEVRAGGFPVGSNNRATTIPGIDYQYFSRPKIHRDGGYDNWFPSASLKYRFTPHLDLHLGYSTTIRRPTIRDLAGVWIINDEAFTINAPNPNLQPETSDNFAARAAYYFEPVGIFAFNVFQNTVQGLHRSTQMTAEEFGNDDPEFSGHTFITTAASRESVRIRGMEIEYSQSLSFLPRPLKGLNLRASYTRNYADVTITNMAPHGAHAGLHYSFNRFSVNTSMNWRDDVPTNLAGTTYVRHRTTIDVGGSVKLTRRFTVFLTGRNIRSEPVVTMVRSGDNPAMTGNPYEVTGAIWNLGLKGAW